MKLLGQEAREPTAEERAKERSVIYTSIADIGIVFLQIVFAIITGSLTLLSEAVRSILMTAVELYSLWLLGAVHRDRLRHFKFGIGKVEQFVWLLIGFGLLLSGLWVASKVVESVFATELAPTPLGLAFAAIVNAINFLINALSFYAMYSASRDDDSDIFRAQLKARGVKLGNSLFLQITLTVGALASDPVIALVLDAVGAGFVSAFMVLSGVSMIARSLPDLLDAPVGESLENLLTEALAGTSHATKDLVGIRTRRAGQYPHVEITVSPTPHRSLGRLRKRVQEIREALHEVGDGIDLSIVVAEEKPKSK